ncbi:MAG: ATP-binding protein [Sphaerochaetaceae bacterium]|nr:ATP-binding protein [Sphaerochaetaceae bacterium]
MYLEFPVEKGDFTKAGEVSSQIKRTLKKLNIPSGVIKKVVVALFEAEVNVIAHSFGGKVTCKIEPKYIKIIVTDTGPGIPDLELAMTEGYSTANQEIQEIGYGAGMGLPNIKKNSDDLNIYTKAGDYTEITMGFKIENE